MPNLPLGIFINAHGDELSSLCRARVAARSEPPPLDAEMDSSGVPRLLTQFSKEFNWSAHQADQIGASARTHGCDPPDARD